MNLDEIFLKSYLNEFGEKEKKKIMTSQEEGLIAAKKKKSLEPIEKFLNKFVELEVKVNHCDQYTKNTHVSDTIEPKLFKFYEVDSSKKWAPGISLFFDHPAQVEIAIPNKVEEEGVVVIKVASHHPDSYILEQRMSTFEQACEALGKFLGRCTHSIGKNPTKYMNKEAPKKATDNFLQNAPENVPEEKTFSQFKKTQELFQKNEEDLQ